MSLPARIGAAAAATFTGVVGVSATAMLVDQGDGNPVFSLEGERFPQDTFVGRWQKMVSNFNPSTLLKSTKEIKEAQELLVRFEQRTVEAGVSDRELWEARKTVESAVHPDTKEIVPPPFRMAGYVPFNGPVCVAMMVNTTTPTLLFWNWVNQSQNALVNYFNRNASSPTSNEVLAMSYAGAVGAALTVAFGVCIFF